MQEASNLSDREFGVLQKEIGLMDMDNGVVIAGGSGV